ncbi:hypothetical protein HAX54_000978 [Datura stramonium]|uniref:Uncharacterized protein n=1 Tax=Datura stramonium TaxID=4076 RepID=A0ABS8WV92_DATST|nr:hypothetical protein [Datura stramonium]
MLSSNIDPFDNSKATDELRWSMRVIKKTMDAKIEKYIERLQIVTLSIPFINALKKTSYFAKCLEELLTKKRGDNDEDTKPEGRTQELKAQGQKGKQKRGDPNTKRTHTHVNGQRHASPLMESSSKGSRSNTVSESGSSPLSTNNVDVRNEAEQRKSPMKL